MDIHVVTSGEYDDYNIEGVFTDPDLAEQAVAWLTKKYHNDMDVRIERWEVSNSLDGFIASWHENLLAMHASMLAGD